MEMRTLFFPYCIQQVGDGRFILLNRNYKPLGVQSTAWVVYENHPSVAQMKITPTIAKKLSWEESEDVNRIYLYSDICTPTDSRSNMTAYLSRLSVLMALKCSASE